MADFQLFEKGKMHQFAPTATSTGTAQRPPPIKPLNRAELEARHAAGLLNIEEAINEAYKDAGVAAPVAPKKELRWQSREGRSMSWTLASFGTITVEIQRHKLGRIQEFGINSWAPIILKDQSPWLTFKVMHKLAEGTKLLYCQHGKIVKDITGAEAPLFQVKVGWYRNTPHTLNDGNYDFSLVLVDKEGVFVQIEVAVTTRDTHFWLSMQETWAAQIARTTKTKAERIKVKTVSVNDTVALTAPLYPENNYPDADFLNAGGMIHGVVAYGVKLGLSKALSECSIAKWSPIEKALPEEMKLAGWMKATVTFLNFAWGQGFALCEDGETCHLHHSKVVDANGVSLNSKGEFPVLHPMHQIAIKWEKGPRGRTAVAIQNL